LDQNNFPVKDAQEINNINQPAPGMGTLGGKEKGRGKLGTGGWEGGKFLF